MRARNRTRHVIIKVIERSSQVEKRSMKLLQQKQQQRKKRSIQKDNCIVFATVNYGPMIEVAIMCDFGFDDGNQEDARFDL